jgi:hypothetical protein
MRDEECADFFSLNGRFHHLHDFSESLVIEACEALIETE